MEEPLGQLSKSSFLGKIIKNFSTRSIYIKAKANRYQNFIYSFFSVVTSIVLISGIIYLISYRKKDNQNLMTSSYYNEILIDTAKRYSWNIKDTNDISTNMFVTDEKRYRANYIIEKSSIQKNEKINLSISDVCFLSKDYRFETEEPALENNFELPLKYNSEDSSISSIKQIPIQDKETINLKDETDDVFLIVDEMPRFRDAGLKEFSKYIHSLIIYPEEAIEKGIEGRLYVQFTVDELGKIINPQIIKGCHPILEKEVLRVLNNSPLWAPGRQNGISVKVSMVIPVDFHLYN
jgi:TonB family protein